MINRGKFSRSSIKNNEAIKFANNNNNNNNNNAVLNNNNNHNFLKLAEKRLKESLDAAAISLISCFLSDSDLF